MELEWRGYTIPVFHLDEDDMLEFIQNKFPKIEFKIVKKEMGLKYGIRNLTGTEVILLSFISSKDNKAKSGIIFTVNCGDTWYQIYFKIEKETLDDKEIKEILFKYIDTVNNF